MNAEAMISGKNIIKKYANFTLDVGEIVIIVMLSAIVGVAILGALAITIGKWKKRDKKKS